MAARLRRSKPIKKNNSFSKNHNIFSPKTENYDNRKANGLQKLSQPKLTKIKSAVSKGSSTVKAIKRPKTAIVHKKVSDVRAAADSSIKSSPSLGLIPRDFNSRSKKGDTLKLITKKVDPIFILSK